MSFVLKGNVRVEQAEDEGKGKRTKREREGILRRSKFSCCTQWLSELSDQVRGGLDSVKPPIFSQFLKDKG